MEYNSLIHAIPPQWKRLLKHPTNEPLIDQELIDKPLLYLNNKYSKPSEIDCKAVYWHFVDKIFIKPSCERKWVEKANINEEHWEHIHTLPYKITRETKLQSFQAKLIHRIFPCNRNLFLWSIRENDLCDLCDIPVQDNIEHYFVFCQSAVKFWNSFKRWWNNVSGINMHISTYEIIFGVLNYNECDILALLNYLLLASKWHIYCCKKEQRGIFFHQYLASLKNHVDIEKYIMYKNGKVVEFHQMWDIVLNSL